MAFKVDRYSSLAFFAGYFNWLHESGYSLSKMKNKILEIQRQYAAGLANSAKDYLTNGLMIFHKRRYSDYSSSQAALGNISIAIELMIKSFLASKNLSLIFKGLPLDLRIIIACPEEIQETPNWRNYELNFKFGNYKTLEFDECVSSFYTFFPTAKKISTLICVSYQNTEMPVSTHFSPPNRNMKLKEQHM